MKDYDYQDDNAILGVAQTVRQYAICIACMGIQWYKVDSRIWSSEVICVTGPIVNSSIIRKTPEYEYIFPFNGENLTITAQPYYNFSSSMTNLKIYI